VARKRKKAPNVDKWVVQNAGRLVGRTGNVGQNQDEWAAERAGRKNPAYGNSARKAATTDGTPVTKGIELGPDGRPVAVAGGMTPPAQAPLPTPGVVGAPIAPPAAPVLPSSTSGTDRVQIGNYIVDQKAAKEALANAGAYMRAFTSQGGREEGFFESLADNPVDKQVNRTIDTGIENTTHWLSQLFNSDDTFGQDLTPGTTVAEGGDLKIMGVPLGAAETVWDGAIRSFGWVDDAVHKVGSFGVSALPGGIETFAWHEADEQSLGQAATADAARRTNQMQGILGDQLGAAVSLPLNVIAGGIIAGAAGTAAAQGGAGTEMAPFAAEDFDIRDAAMRKAAFEDSEVGKWMTGLADAGIAIAADPGLVVGKIMKIGKLRFLDRMIVTKADTDRVVNRLARDVERIDIHRTTIDPDDPAALPVTRAVEDMSVDEFNQLPVSEYSKLAHLAVARKETADSLKRRDEIAKIADPQERAIKEADFTPEYVKVADEGTLFEHHLLKDATARESFSQALRNARTFEEAVLLIRHGAKDMSASARLSEMAPDLYAHVLEGEQRLLSMMIRTDPDLVAKEAARWSDRYDMVKKRLDDLTVLRADPAEIARTRLALATIDDNWKLAARGDIAPLGAGPASTPAEIDLARRAIDKQLDGNYRFQRALTEADGNNSALFGALSGRTKGVVDIAGDADPEGLVGRIGLAAERAVTKSRIERAKRSSDIKKAGNPLEAARAGWRSESFYGIDRKNPIAVIHHYSGMEQLGKAQHAVGGAFRYLWVEKPSGMIHTSGIGAQESSREIRAVVRDMDLYKGPAKQARNEWGEALYRTPDGKKTTDKSAKGAEPFMVGGEARGEELVSAYANALALGGREAQQDIRKFIADLEEEFVTDISYAAGISRDLLDDVHYRQNLRLEKIEKQIKEDKYWTEEGNKTRHYAPWLETHLQGSTFMKNWGRIEQEATRVAMHRRTQRVGHTAADEQAFKWAKRWDFTRDNWEMMDAALQSVWRPMVLLRLGYTQRNVLEGLFRASALSFSLAPVWDTGKQLGLSAGNITRKMSGAQRRAAGVVDKAKDGVSIADMPPKFRRWYDTETRAARREADHTRNLVTEQRATLARESAAYRTRRAEQLNERYAQVLDTSRKAREGIDLLEQRETFLTEEVTRLLDLRTERTAKGLEFGKRNQDALDKAMAGLDESELAMIRRMNSVIDLNTDRLVAYSDEMRELRQAAGGDVDLTPEQIRQMDQLDYLEDVDLPYREMVVETLDDPLSAAQVYQRQTMAKRRVHGQAPRHIADPDTMASIMKGKALADPFNPEDPYTAIALQNLSADATMRQTAAMRMQAVTDGFALQQTRYYIDIDPREATYFDGVATVINQVQNSSIGQILIRGRAQGLGDDEIIDDVVRFLYETDEGAVVGDFLNQANDIAFSDQGAFQGVRAQVNAEMRRRVKEGLPLEQAAEDARRSLKSAYGAALSARARMPKARFAGDTPDIPARKWAGDSYGEYTVATTGRGKWEVTDAAGNVTTATNRNAARKMARDLQDAADNETRDHWTLKQPVTAGGRDFYTEADIDLYIEEMRTLRDDAVNTFEAFDSRPIEIKGNGARMNVDEAEDARLYAAEALRRYDLVTDGNSDLQRYLYANPQLPIGGTWKDTDAGDVIRGFLEGSETLQPVIGNMASYVGTKKYMDVQNRFTQKMFRLLGTIPEDNLVRAPFYGRTFKKYANDAYNNIVGQLGDEGLVTMKEVNAIRELAHRRALKDTKDWLYTIDRRTVYGDFMERFVPFSSATQNSVTTVGKLVWHDPSLPAIMSLIWQAPDRAGLTDGDDVITLPIGWVPQGIRDTWLNGSDELNIGKKSLDLLFNGITDPSSVPQLAVLSSELMKHGLFGAYTSETPPWLAWAGETGDFIWQEWKDYTLGEGFGASQSFGSYDKAVAPWLRRGVEALIVGPGNSASYGAQVQGIMLSQSLKYAAGEREDPIGYEEATDRANWMTAARMLGNVLLPFAPKYDTSRDTKVPEGLREQASAAGLDPLLTVAEAIRKNDEAYYADQARIALLKAGQRAGYGVNPADLEPTVMPSEELFGEEVWMASKFKTRENVAGLPATNAGVQFAQDNYALLDKIAPDLDKAGRLDAIGMFTIDTEELYDPDSNAIAWYVANDIPGTNEPFMDVNDPAKAEREVSRQMGWKVYLRGKEAIEMDMARNGIKSFNSAASIQNGYDKMLRDFEETVARGFPGWFADKDDPAGKKANRVTEAIWGALNDEGFQKQRKDDPVWARGGFAHQYVTGRKQVVEDVEAVKQDMYANGINSLDSAAAKAAGYPEMVAAVEMRWAETQYNLRRASPTWSAIQDRYIGEDSDPGRIYYFEYEEAS
jgi:hypothetical protein